MKTIHSFGTSLEYHIIMQIKATLPSGRVQLKRTNHILKRYRRKLCKFCKNMLADLKKDIMFLILWTSHRKLSDRPDPTFQNV